MVVSLSQGMLNQVATACPSPAVVAGDSVHVDALPNDTAHTFRITTSRPAIVHEIWPFTKNSIDYSTIATLPAISSWSDEYLDVGTYLPPPYEYAPLVWSAAVAGVDGTKLDIPSMDGGLASRVLASDELLNVTRADLFVGQTVTASHPFSLWSGSAGFQVPPNPEASTSCFGSFAVPPVSRWGRTYVIAPPSDRVQGTAERHFARIVAAADGTTLTYSPVAPSGAVATLGAGQLATFMHEGPLVIQSQDASHPIFVATYNVDPSDFGDASVVKDGGCSAAFLVPEQQFGTEYRLFSLPNYPNTELVLVRRAGGASTVDVDCAGSITAWSPVGDFEVARVWLSRDTGDAFSPQVFPSGTCDNGPHAVRSGTPFGVIVSGWVRTPFGPFLGQAAGSDPNAQAASSYEYVPIPLDEPNRN